MRYDRNKLVHQVINDSTALSLENHSTDHWLRVAQNGIILAQVELQDPVFCEIFGLLHDCQRLDDGKDKEHGARAAAYAYEIRDLIPLNKRDKFRLAYALKFHDEKVHTEDPQVGCCWDADRLDLPRVGVVVDPYYLNTDAAKEIVIRDQGRT